MDIPVYLFTGFIESGKTKFIQETLTDVRFNNGEKTLLLLCEEGIEEYDPSEFSGKNVNIQTVNKEDLTAQQLESWRKKCKAERVIIEYNGMWQLRELFDNLPDKWIIAQEFFFADASTFLSYNANMRSLVVDKLTTCELAVFNRYNDSIDKMELHKIVRGVNRTANIAYEKTNGDVEYDDMRIRCRLILMHRLLILRIRITQFGTEIWARSLTSTTVKPLNLPEWRQKTDPYRKALL